MLLYEDDLDDFGYSQLRVRLRAQKDSIFILLRSYVRVDNTAVRIVDNRFFIDFNDFEESSEKGTQAPEAPQKVLIKQTDYLEASWNEILSAGFTFNGAFNLDFNQSDQIAKYLKPKLTSVNTLYF